METISNFIDLYYDLFFRLNLLSSLDKHFLSSWARPQFSYFLCELLYYLCIAWSIRGRNPRKPETLRFQSETLKGLVQNRKSSARIVISLQVMTISWEASGYNHAISSSEKRFDNEHRVDAARTHHPNNPERGRHLQPADAGQICPGIRAPITKKCHYPWFEFLSHFPLPRLLPHQQLKVSGLS